MLSRIWFLNVILAALTLFFGLNARDVWTKNDKTAIRTKTAGQQVEQEKVHWP